MNNTSVIEKPASSERSTHLLNCIRAFRTCVGDGLNDFEFTQLLGQSGLPSEAGFEFVSYCERFVTLSVPKQEDACWFPEKGWILPEKEKLARTLAEKYGLSLCMPPDALYVCCDAPQPHHHLEMSNKWETIIVAHPRYLKVRAFAATDPTRSTRTALRPLQMGPELLKDLSGLYA
jgi:hypothetical protein